MDAEGGVARAAEYEASPGLVPWEADEVVGGRFSPQTRAILDTLSPRPEDLDRRYPPIWDWREMGGVTPTMDQGDCGSCWACAAIAEFEGNLRLAEGLILNLSEQQAVDCNTWGCGCDGGWPEAAYEVAESPGAVSEECMPYIDGDGSCGQRLCEKVAFIDGYQFIAGNVNSYKAALLNGPLSACYWYLMGSGPGGEDDQERGGRASRGGHCIAIVGWNDNVGIEGSWICKDSSLDGYDYMGYDEGGITSGALQCVNPHLPRTRLVPDEFPTIQAAIDSSETGDVIKIAAGIYHENITLTKLRSLIGGYDSTFTQRDPEAYPTIVDAGGAGDGIRCVPDYLGADHIVIDGLEVRNSGTSSYGIYVPGGTATVRNCWIRDCWRGIGVFGVGSDEGTVRIERCTVRNNASHGVFVSGVTYQPVGIMLSAIYGNGGAGVHSDGSTTSVGYNTIVGNGIGGGVDVTGSDGNSIGYNIVVSNEGWGVRFDGQGALLVRNDVWNNGLGDYYGCSPGPGSISEDPVFCDAEAFDFTLHATSPCLGGESGDVIGAYGIGCPEGPEGLEITQCGASLELTWSPPPDDVEVDHYIVYRDTLSWRNEPIAVVHAPDTTFTDITVPPCESQDYCVSAVDTAGLEGAPSDEVVAELCYGGAHGLTVTFIEGANEMSWSLAEGPVDRYVIMRGTETADPDSIGWVSSSDTSFVDDSSDDCPRDNYAYEVLPVYDTGWRGAPSDEVAVDPSPSPPEGLSAEWLADDVILTWAPNCESDLRRYWVYRDTMPISPPPDSELLIGFTPDTSFIDGAANPEWDRFYRVVASDASSQKSRYSGMVYLGSGEVLTVPSPYGTIQAAIDAASALDTVLVSPGTYPENITLEDGVFVMSSDGRATTTIQSLSGEIVTASTVSDLALLKGFTIDGLGSAQCGLDSWGSYVNVEECAFVNLNTGSNVRYGGAPTFTSNLFSGNQMGLACADSAAPFLSGNTFDGNSCAGVYVSGDARLEVGRALSDANDFANLGVYYVLNASANEVDADYNYWGDICPSETWFFGPVDYIPWTDESHSAVYTDCTGVPDEVVERAFAGHNFPNPFNPSTTIRYTVPSPGAPVRLVIYDLTGQRVRTLVNEEKDGGTHLAVWRGRDDAGGDVASGVYFYRMDIGGYRAERKMVLLK
jgi:hypothetical protein